MQLQITHTTRYDYDQPVDYALQKLRLRPADNPLQTVTAWELNIEGGQIEADYTDHHGNRVDLVSVIPGTTHVSITAKGTVNTAGELGVLGHYYGVMPLWHYMQATPLTTAGDGITALSKDLMASDDPLAGLHDLSAAILAKAPYVTGKTYADTLAEDALAGGAGVCQDHAQIFVSAARAAGLPARYVSGYLMMNDRIDQDASHAWAEVYLDTLGWVGFDVSNIISPDQRYVRLAVGRDAHEAAPMSGLRLGNADERMVVSLQVQQ